MHFFTDAGQFELFNVLIKQSYRSSSRRSLTRLQKTVQNMGSKVQNVQRAEDGEKGAQNGEAVPKKRQCLKRREGSVVRDAVSL